MTTAAISGSLTVGADSASDDVVTVGTDTLNFTGGEGIDTQFQIIQLQLLVKMHQHQIKVLHHLVQITLQYQVVL